MLACAIRALSPLALCGSAVAQWEQVPTTVAPPARNFLNSTFVNVQSLRTIEGRPILEIHPDDAEARGIQPYLLLLVRHF